MRRTTTDNDTSYIFVKGDLKIVEHMCMGGEGRALGEERVAQSVRAAVLLTAGNGIITRHVHFYFLFLRFIQA